MRRLKILGGCLGITIVGLVLAVSVADHFLYGSKGFDAESWRVGDVRQRASMARRLQRSHILVGMNRAEVLELLGPPDHEYGQELDYDFVQGKLVSDWLSLPSADWLEWLAVEFDSTGRVKGASIHD